MSATVRKPAELLAATASRNHVAGNRTPRGPVQRARGRANPARTRPTPKESPSDDARCRPRRNWDSGDLRQSECAFEQDQAPTPPPHRSAMTAAVHANALLEKLKQKSHRLAP